MKTKRTFFLIMLVTLIVSCREDDPQVRFLKTVSNEVILTGYQNLSLQADVLYKEALLCKDAGVNYQSRLERLQFSWKQVMQQWQSVQWVQFGPIKQDGREWSLQFWPDKKNLVGKKVKRLLKKQAIITDQQIESGGVIVQGLSALEYLLFDSSLNALSTPEQRCLSAIPMARAVQSTSNALVDDWMYFYKENVLKFNKPTPEAEMITAEQGLSIVVNNLIAFFDAVVDKKVVSPFSLKKSNIKPNAYFLESWRSQYSRDNIQHNVLLVKKMFLVGGLKALLNENKRPDVAEAALKEIDVLLSLLEEGQSPPSFFMQLSATEKKSIEEVQVLYQSMTRLRRILRKDLTAALNVQIGFNSSDGDS